MRAFTDLPRELRDIVYFYILYDLSTRYEVSQGMQTSNPFVFHPLTLPSIAFTSKAILEEVLCAYIPRARFMMSSFRDRSALTRFLDQPRIRDEAFRAVRMLGFRNLKEPPIYARSAGTPDLCPLELSDAGYCPEYLTTYFPLVRSLVLELNNELSDNMVFLWQYEVWGTLGIRNAIKAALGCDRLFTVKSLKHLKVVLRPRQDYLGGEEYHKPAIDLVSAYLHECLDKVGRSMRIEVSAVVQLD